MACYHRGSALGGAPTPPAGDGAGARRMILPGKEARVSAKDTVRALLDRLPDNCTLDDIAYQVHVVQAIERGLADAAAGRTVPHAQVVAELRRKWSDTVE